MTECDFFIVGAGIAGASAAYGLAPLGSTIVAEAESQPGYHTTGRSAAFFSETYGNAVIRALTAASRSFFVAPPDGFSEAPLLGDRGVLHIGRSDQREKVAEKAREVAELSPSTRQLDGDGVRTLAPALRADYAVCGLLEPEAKDIDVHALHHGFLRAAKKRGSKLITGARVVALQRRGERWRVETEAGSYTARIIVNAAGAWGDEVAALAGSRAVGLAPKRRTILIGELANAPRGGDMRRWPLVIDIDETFYFKPESGGLLISPCDETPTPPCDARPEEADIASAIARVGAAADLSIRRLVNKWAGLRTFAPDRTPVVGYDGGVPGFFWFAGQGGYGIQTSPAMSRLAAALATGKLIPADLAALGVTERALSPRRFAAGMPN